MRTSTLLKKRRRMLVFVKAGELRNYFQSSDLSIFELLNVEDTRFSSFVLHSGSSLHDISRVNNSSCTL